MTSLDETSIALDAGSASSLNVSLDVTTTGKKTQCPGVPLPVGLQPTSSTPVVSTLSIILIFSNDGILAHRWRR